ncbi:unnamed protein product [Cochlearia groenlandica]
MKEGGEYSPAMTSSNLLMTMKKKKSNNNNNQRRFSDVQIKSLEMMFETETRLEPRKKVQLARELGLQPRQVAIWFQNKRSRWKSKQLETEFNILRQNYDDLSSKFESLKKDNQSLISELKRLNESIPKPHEEERKCSGDKVLVALSSTEHETENQRCEPEEEVRPEMEKDHHHGVLCDHHDDDYYKDDDDDDDDDDMIKREYLGGFEEEADQLMNIVEQTDSCLTSSDDRWRVFNSDTTTNLLDQSSNNYPWWDFWS